MKTNFTNETDNINGRYKCYKYLFYLFLLFIVIICGMLEFYNFLNPVFPLKASSLDISLLLINRISFIYQLSSDFFAGKIYGISKLKMRQILPPYYATIENDIVICFCILVANGLLSALDLPFSSLILFTLSLLLNAINVYQASIRISSNPKRMKLIINFHLRHEPAIEKDYNEPNNKNPIFLVLGNITITKGINWCWKEFYSKNKENLFSLLSLSQAIFYFDTSESEDKNRTLELFESKSYIDGLFENIEQVGIIYQNKEVPLNKYDVWYYASSIMNLRKICSEKGCLDKFRRLYRKWLLRIPDVQSSNWIVFEDKQKFDICMLNYIMMATLSIGVRWAADLFFHNRIYLQRKYIFAYYYLYFLIRLQFCYLRSSEMKSKLDFSNSCPDFEKIDFDKSYVICLDFLLSFYNVCDEDAIYFLFIEPITREQDFAGFTKQFIIHCWLELVFNSSMCILLYFGTIEQLEDVLNKYKCKEDFLNEIRINWWDSEKDTFKSCASGNYQFVSLLENKELKVKETPNLYAKRPVEDFYRKNRGII